MNRIFSRETNYYKIIAYILKHINIRVEYIYTVILKFLLIKRTKLNSNYSIIFLALEASLGF